MENNLEYNIMSINALTSKDTDKGWANLYVNTLTAYNGIFGEFKGSSDVSGQTTFKDDVLFEEDVIMEESLKILLRWQSHSCGPLGGNYQSFEMHPEGHRGAHVGRSV